MKAAIDLAFSFPFFRWQIQSALGITYKMLRIRIFNIFIVCAKKKHIEVCLFSLK